MAPQRLLLRPRDLRARELEARRFARHALQVMSLVEDYHGVAPVDLPSERASERAREHRGEGKERLPREIRWRWGRGGKVEEGGVPDIMHGHSRMTIDPRIPTMPRQSTSGFHRPGRQCMHQARRAVRCSASRMKGELHPTKKRL